MERPRNTGKRAEHKPNFRPSRIVGDGPAGLDFEAAARHECGVGQDLDELFDVVDEADRVVGRAPRREVHARGWRHRAVHVFVVNAAGEVFLHQRSLAKDTFPGLWNSSCAGHVGAGDDYDETVVREMEEELGRRPAAAPVRLFKVEARPETGEEFVWVYRAQAEGPFELNPAEIQRGAWFRPAAIDAWVANSPEQFAASFVFLWPRVRGSV